MRKNKSKSFDIKQKNPSEQQYFNQKRGMSDYSSYTTIEHITWLEILEKIIAGINKMFIFIKYQFFKHTFGLFENTRISWFKVGLVALILFIFIKKDFQFSFNMKNPATTNTEQMEDGKVVKTVQQQELGIGNSIALLSGTNEEEITLLDELNDEKVTAYIQRFSHVAIGEMEKYDIPASIKMAQGILESQAGEIPKNIQQYNHFGKPVLGQNYNNDWENWRIHSLFLSKTKFRELKKHGNDYKKWAKGLEELGYSSNKEYARQLVMIVEKYNLVQLDS